MGEYGELDLDMYIEHGGRQFGAARLFSDQLAGISAANSLRSGRRSLPNARMSLRTMEKGNESKQINI